MEGADEPRTNTRSPVGAGPRLRDGLRASGPALLAAAFGITVTLGGTIVVLAGGGGRTNRGPNDYAPGPPTEPTSRASLESGAREPEGGSNRTETGVHSSAAR